MVEVVVTGLGFLEGPVWREASGDLVVTSMGAGSVLRVDVDAGTSEVVAHTDGTPNGAFPTDDGGLLVTQNGGLNWEALGVDHPDPPVPTTPGIQRIHADGRVELLTGGDGPFVAPNDLFATPDGTLWFTDPPKAPLPTEPVGRVWRWRPGERPAVFASDFTFCNGIGVDADGQVIIVEGDGLMVVGPDGERSWLVETLPHRGDGFAFDVDGRIYVAGRRGVAVVDRDGTVVDQLTAAERHCAVTNCCFGGTDHRTLYVTDLAEGRVFAFPAMPVAGRVLTPVPAASFAR